MLAATLLSPIIFNASGYLACYITKLGAFICALLYLLVLVREPIKASPKVAPISADQRHPGCVKKLRDWFNKYLITPFLQIIRTVFQKRDNGLRALLFIQLFVYGMYWFLVDQNAQMQLYLMKVFPGFTSADYSHYLAFIKVVSIISLLVIMPILSRILKWHEGAILTLITFSYTLGHLIMAYATKLW